MARVLGLEAPLAFALDQRVQYRMPKYDGEVEYAQRGLIHSHNLHRLLEVRAAAKLRARQHAVSVMRSSGVLAILRECQARAFRKCLTQYSKSNSNSPDIGMISRWLPVARSVQFFRPISALSLAKITRMYALFNFMLSLWSLLYALVAGVLALEAPRAFVLNLSKPPI